MPDQIRLFDEVESPAVESAEQGGHLGTTVD